MTLSSPIRIGVALAAAATGALLAACDDEAPAPRPVLATLSGTISATEPPPADAEIRVALLWATNSKSWEDKSIKHFVAQDVLAGDLPARDHRAAARERPRSRRRGRPGHRLPRPQPQRKARLHAARRRSLRRRGIRLRQ